MKFKTLEECKEEINKRAGQIDSSYLAAQSLFEMMWQFIVFINAVIIIFMIVVLIVNPRMDIGILNDLKIRHLIIFLFIYFFEGLAKAYAKSVVINDHIVHTKTEMCKNLLKNCEEYNNLADWQKKQTFDNEIISVAGMATK